MIYVGHLFRWQPESPHLLARGRRWDHHWCRLWSDKSFAEMSEAMFMVRGPTYAWRQDGNSLPYYIITPELRKRALARGAQIKDWNNPQLPTGVTLKYASQKYIEKEQATLTFQQETEGGTVTLLNSEESILAAASLLRNQPRNAADGHLPTPGNPDTPPPTPGEVPV